jgi:hypothetical protein
MKIMHHLALQLTDRPEPFADDDPIVMSDEESA